jgi:hypothetical protein
MMSVVNGTHTSFTCRCCCLLRNPKPPSNRTTTASQHAPRVSCLHVSIFFCLIDDRDVSRHHDEAPPDGSLLLVVSRKVTHGDSAGALTLSKRKTDRRIRGRETIQHRTTVDCEVVVKCSAVKPTIAICSKYGVEPNSTIELS